MSQTRARARGQHHKLLASLTAGGLALGLVVAAIGIAMRPGETLWHLIAAPEEDGGWKFVTIDGVDVSEDGYSIGVRWGKLSGYNDGCNSCGFDAPTDPDNPYYSRVCTLTACTERPRDALLGRFLVPYLALQADGDRMVATVPGHRAGLARAP